MDPNLLFAEVLVVAILRRMKVERMKVEMMKVERKKHLELQCFVLFYACDRVGFQETQEQVFMVWAHCLAKLLFPEQLLAVVHQLHSSKA